MLRYILRRSAYSILIMFGVLLLTFLLFRVAAGDPAAAVLGKNPSAEELELMRNRLGTSKPLLFGNSRETLRYPGGDFTNKKALPKSAIFHSLRQSFYHKTRLAKLKKSLTKNLQTTLFALLVTA